MWVTSDRTGAITREKKNTALVPEISDSTRNWATFVNTTSIV